MADDIIAHVRLMQDGERETKMYFRSDSEAWTAIQKHISYAKECAFFERTDSIRSYRGTGPAVHFRDITVYGTQFKGSTPYEVDFFQIDVDIEFENDEYADETRHDRLHINVPFDLELNFTQEKFDAWIAEKLEERKKKEGNKDREIFDTLLKKYPEWFNRET